MKPLITLLLYTLLALCVGLFGYSVWQGITQPPDEPDAGTAPQVLTTPLPASTEPVVAFSEDSALLYEDPALPSEDPALESESPPLPHEPAVAAALPTTDGAGVVRLNDSLGSDHTLPPHSTPRIAIIIDDVGYNLPYGRQLAQLPGALTLAVLPHSPHGVELAELGHGQGKEIMLHVPMSTVVPRKLDTGGLTAEMSQQEFERILDGNLESIPHVRGLNNHMGSELTRLQQPMQWLMHVLAQEKLFFIDSRTSVDSVAQATAQQYRVPTRKRDVFLDNSRETDDLQRQFDVLIRLALQQGSAIAIGHPYPETVAFLQQALPGLAGLGVELVPVSELLPRSTSQKSVESDSTPSGAPPSDL